MFRLPLALAAVFALAACEVGETAVDMTAEQPAEAAPAVLPASLPADAPVLTVYKSPTCGCCKTWATYMEGEGFRVESRDVADLTAVKDSLGVPSDLASCHTGVVDGYVVEGHVPAEHVRRLLAERPEARGLAVPGMPIGSPGMEQGDLRQPYDVLVVGEGGEAAVYAHVEGNARP
ncbi:DUF411 domain-containing protein [Rubrivirga sp. S365]|uniref:DUF411 domain-containing protein n=1 Tax=Rubrivirga litoralis TaxID=3075598 RepID=A0ABU3BSQ2_9BACT|nr:MULTISPECIES: DUF411 domain-containing protein [unclassified Rubrivirga]MDT0632196.1 DUF411 domain-containing protein [Rubrivirga sp. F394]MDT7856806.1 DUF411 domain-containing protein [Rubrivirga sp. S365]